MPCFSWTARKERWNILLLGDNEVGKTSFAYRFSDNVFEESFEKMVFSGSHMKECYFSEGDYCRVCLSDTWVSQISYTGFDEALPFCHGIILMYSISSRWSFQDVARTCRQIPLDTKADPHLVLILVGTKSDDKQAREVSANEGAALAQDLGCKAFFETSAKSGENVDAAVFAMVQALRQADKDQQLGLMSPVRMIQDMLSCFGTSK